MEHTVDILSHVAEYRSAHGWPRLVIGFAAESRELLENARRKMIAKRMDMIVANDISATDAGFAVETNRVSLLYPNGKTENLPLMSKMEVAEVILSRIVTLQ
jgi:phosphopantothenoylcysteine decarboxylase/phosphopantothenate--cysteine ligase